jgi:hypothetical protein
MSVVGGCAMRWAFPAVCEGWSAARSRAGRRCQLEFAAAHFKSTIEVGRASVCCRTRTANYGVCQADVATVPYLGAATKSHGGLMTYCPTCMRYVNGAVSCPGCGVLASELEQAEPEATQPLPLGSDAARPVRLSLAGEGVSRPSHTRARPRRKPLIVTALAAVTLTAGLAAASGLGILPGQTGAHTSSTPPSPNHQDPQAGSLPQLPAAPDVQSALASPGSTPASNTAARATAPSFSPSVPTGQPVAPSASVQSSPDAPPVTASPAPASPTPSPPQTSPPGSTAEPSPSWTRHHGD